MKLSNLWNAEGSRRDFRLSKMKNYLIIIRETDFYIVTRRLPGFRIYPIKSTGTIVRICSCIYCEITTIAKVSKLTYNNFTNIIC